MLQKLPSNSYHSWYSTSTKIAVLQPKLHVIAVTNYSHCEINIDTPKVPQQTQPDYFMKMIFKLCCISQILFDGMLYWPTFKGNILKQCKVSYCNSWWCLHLMILVLTLTKMHNSSREENMNCFLDDITLFPHWACIVTCIALFTSLGTWAKQRQGCGEIVPTEYCL